MENIVPCTIPFTAVILVFVVVVTMYGVVIFLVFFVDVVVAHVNCFAVYIVAVVIVPSLIVLFESIVVTALIL